MVWSYNGNDTALDTAGNILAGRVFTIWTAETGGTQLISTVRNWAGSTVTSGQITSESDGRVRFKETSDSHEVLWLKAPDNSMYPVVALEAVGAGGGGGVSLSANNTWTGVQSFSTNPVFNDGAIPQAKVSGLGTALTAATNPVQRSDTANQTAMLALTANKGDWTYRSDTTSVWMLLRGTDPTTLANWVDLGAGSGSFTRSYANAEAGSVYYIKALSSASRPSARTDIMFFWLTTDALTPTNKAGDDIWLNALEA